MLRFSGSWRVSFGDIESPSRVADGMTRHISDGMGMQILSLARHGTRISRGSRNQRTPTTAKVSPNLMGRRQFLSQGRRRLFRNPKQERKNV